MNTLYLICFVLGLVLSLLAALGGLGRLHVGHMPFGHAGQAHAAHLHAKHPGVASAFNGFTIPAFLCWFGGVGYLLANFSSLGLPLILLLALACGPIGASVLYFALFKLLLPRERVMAPEDTRMDGVVARVSDEIRLGGGTGEILFTQLETRRSAAARSDDGEPIPRGTEVIVLRYERGIAYVTPLDSLLP